MTQPGTVIGEIVAASEGWEPWTKDALRRVVEQGQATAEDAAELVRLRVGEACDADFSPDEAYRSLGDSESSGVGAPQAEASLVSIRHIRGVNFLGEDLILPLDGDGLHIIYGNNATGKTGYSRIIKSACRFRGKKSRIEGDIALVTPPSAEAEIKYRVGAEERTLLWNSAAEHDHDELRSVLLFDSDVASSYISGNESPCFVPFGLGIPDMLVRLVDEVRRGVEAEETRLASKNAEEIDGLRLVPGTKSARLFESEAIQKRELEVLLAIPKDEERRFREARALLDSKDREGLIKEYGDCDSRLKDFRTSMSQAVRLCASEELGRIAAALAERKATQEKAESSRELLRGSSVFPGIGGGPWRELWDGAKEYSTHVAYLDKSFPNVEEGAACVLCQTQLDAEAAKRLSLFAEALTRQEELDLARLEGKLSDLSTTYGSLPKLVERLTVVDQMLGQLIGQDKYEELRLGIVSLDESVAKVARSLRIGDASGLDPCQPVAAALLVDEAIVRNEARLGQARDIADPAEEQRQRQFVAEIESRRKLVAARETIDRIIARLAKIKRLRPMYVGNSRHITKLADELYRKYVTEKYFADFQAEIDSLCIGRIRPKPEIKTSKAITKIGVCLEDCARKIAVENIASEGEQRAIALACFLAELGQGGSGSTLVFDDPISSMDHVNKERIAKRLVTESKRRQVIIFTHDDAFALELIEEAKDVGIVPKTGMLEWQDGRSGHYSPRFPWGMLKVGERVDLLEKSMAEIKRKRQPQATQEDIASIRQWYSDFRATVERTIEERLFCNVLVRGQRYIDLKELNVCSDIPTVEVAEVQRLFGIGCDHCSAHEQLAGSNPEVPTSEEMARALADLRVLHDTIKARQKAKRWEA